jgi:hypothetical protein
MGRLLTLLVIESLFQYSFFIPCYLERKPTNVTTPRCCCWLQRAITSKLTRLPIRYFIYQPSSSGCEGRAQQCQRFLHIPSIRPQPSQGNPLWDRSWTYSHLCDPFWEALGQLVSLRACPKDYGAYLRDPLKVT